MNLQVRSLLVLAAGLVLLAAACGTAATARPSGAPPQTLAAAVPPTTVPTDEPAPTQRPQVQPTAVSTPAPSPTPIATAAVKATPSPTIPVAGVTPEADPARQADIIDFVLPDVTVAVGGTVRWTNLDAAAHTATPGTEGINDRSGWDSQGLELDQSYSRRFDEVGVFAYTCRFHPWMNATVTVVDAQAAPASGSGDYYVE